MRIKQKKLILSSLLSLGLLLPCESIVYAAQAINLNKQEISTLETFLSTPANITEISRSVDFNKTLHVRIQQTYAGYSVWGADAVVHIPNGEKIAHTWQSVFDAAKNNHGSVNGILYKNLRTDLAKIPTYIVSESQAQIALHYAIDHYQHKVGGQLVITEQQSKPIIFITKDNKAHWAYKISFFVAPIRAGAIPAKPTYLMDAMSFQVYTEWDDMQTTNVVKAAGGGLGGNQKMGQFIYDGLTNHLAELQIKRDTAKKLCYLRNTDVTVKNYRDKKVMNFICNVTDNQHNNVYWDGDQDAVNGGYSPSNDALFGGAVIKDMYMKWYGVPVLTKNNKPMMLTMLVHMPVDNAYWDGKQMAFGDGVSMFYPLTSLGVAAHEISHGFTEQHSNLTYEKQSGGMNEAYSDMAAQAAEFYAYGKNSWQIGPEIIKADNKALRYMDQPSKDCKGKNPGNWCSIDTFDQYYDGLDVHFSSGIYNRFFYLLGTSSGWDTKKAFDVMVQANINYWTANSTFVAGACGVIKATEDYKYDVDAVKKAFHLVGIDVGQCS